MDKHAEITWSLMHPTPLDPEYMRKVVSHAAAYPVDSFELCAECHSNYGGLDGLSDYADFPNTHARLDLAKIADNRRKLGEILRLAHAIGKPLYYWHREAMVPDGLLTDLPDLLDENGEFDLLGPAYEKLLRYKIRSAFGAMPELDGLVLTLTEATYSVIHNSNTEKYPPRKVVAHLVDIFADELTVLGKHFVLRSFGSIAKDYEDIIAGATAAAAKLGFEIETKITPYDFDPFLPVNPFLRKVPGAELGAECDGLGEFLGAGMLPAENVENIVNYVRTGRAAGVDRYAIRLDRCGKNIFDCYEINLYAYSRAIADERVTAEDIRREWLAGHAPASAADTFAELGLQGLEMVKKNNFIDGNVIFHQFPSQETLKYLKAGFIFALFKNGVDLHNGSGVWSILSGNRTPGRAAVIREKEEAVAIASAGVARLQALKHEPGFEREYAWRERLWHNAVIASGASLALIKCICAYFDDMEALSPEAPRFHSELAKAEKYLTAFADDQVAGPAAGFTNGLELKLFEATGDAVAVYIRPYLGIVRLLASEYPVELAMRQKYGSGAVDYLLCGAITDEWRVARYMHAAHANMENGRIYRIAGNSVFPNGFLEMTLKRPACGVLRIFGDISETVDFTLEFDGGAAKPVCFTSDGTYEMSLPAGGGECRLRLSKSGGFYPRFLAVVTAEK